AAAALSGEAEHLAGVQHQVRSDHGVHRGVAHPVVHVQAVDLQQRPAGEISGPNVTGPAEVRCDGARCACGAAADHGCSPSRRRTTGVTPSLNWRGTGPTAYLFTRLRVRPAARSRGLMNSSMPKLSSASAVPRKATARPGGSHHHQYPLTSALALCAQNSIVPQFQCAGLTRPRKAMAM